MNNRIDHIAIGAADLDQGVAMVKDALGVELPRGSKHVAMSTHNCVAPTGNESFLEIISIDPEAPPPGRTRWFTLDNPETQRKLENRPRPLCWVVGTENLDAIVAASPVDLGEIVTFTRGDRSWRLTVPEDGTLLEGGLLPAFIEWSPGPHPSSGMTDLGVKLKKVVLKHPEPERLNSLLSDLQILHLAEVQEGESPVLSFVLSAPGNDTVELV